MQFSENHIHIVESYSDIEINDVSEENNTDNINTYNKESNEKNNNNNINPLLKKELIDLEIKNNI